MSEIRDFVEKLDRLGFYSLCAPGTAEQVRRESIDTKYVLYEGTNRVFNLDAEDLAERGPLDFIHTLLPTFKLLGLDLFQLEEPFVQGVKSDLVINSYRFPLWRMPEDRDNRDRDKNLWEQCTHRTLGALNYVLKEAGFQDRFFITWIGNDSMVVLAVPAVLDELLRDDNLRYAERLAHAIPEIVPLTEDNDENAEENA